MHESSRHSVKYPVFVLLWTYCTGRNINDVAFMGTESTLCDLCPELRVGIMQHSSELSQLTRCEHSAATHFAAGSLENLTVWSQTFRSIYPAGWIIKEHKNLAEIIRTTFLHA